MPIQKIKKILIGTNNKGKLREIREILPKRVKSYPSIKFTGVEPVENGISFSENSFIKAKFFSKKTNMICLADDSGLEINILNNQPGIYSARWGGKKKDFDKAIQKVFRQLKRKDKDWKKKKIKCRFVCSLTLYWPGGKYITKVGSVRGTISKVKKGKKGFGYDPIFIPLRRKLTFGEMQPKLKHRIDHRYKAFKKIRKFF